MTRTRAGQALTELILEIFRVNGRVLMAGDTLTHPLGQTSARWQVLGALDEVGRSVADVARRMGLTRQSVQRTADLLEADGLIVYADNPSHQRAKLATLTPRGRTTLDAITSRQIEWVNRAASRFSEDDLQQAVRTLQQVREAVDAPAAAVDRQTKAARVQRAPRASRGSTKRRSTV